MKLTDENKQKFEEQVLKITEKDEVVVKEKIAQEITDLANKVASKPNSKMEELLHNASLLHEILKNDQFPISESSKKWIVFGLRYLVSDIDLIPDGIPVVGYYDDVMIINWVVYMIDQDIKRYQLFKKAEAFSISGGLIKKYLDMNADSELIIIPGLISNYTDNEVMQKWVQHISDLPSYQKSDISIMEYSFDHLIELNKTLKMVDHDLRLKPVYDFDAFQLDWQQTQKECDFLAAGLAIDIKNRLQENPNKKISFLVFDVGSRMISGMLAQNGDTPLHRLYILGGITCNLCNEPKHLKHIDKVFNFYSESDYALKFIFDNVEKNQKPIGMQPLYKSSLQNVENINISKEVKNHFEYKFKAHLLIDQTC
jgi:uncharacterized membrane protein YkvA (DUF1232 family)